MGTVIVKDMAGMQRENGLWRKRVIGAQTRTLMRIADLNEARSKEIASSVKFTGELISKITTKMVNKLRIQVISSAPHSYAIETGKPAKRGYVSLLEPGLENWVRNKLMRIEPGKASYFLRRGEVLIGEHGFPYKYPDGIKFMEIGFNLAAANASIILGEELRRLN